MSFEAATTGVAGASIDGVRGVELTVGTLGVGRRRCVRRFLGWRRGADGCLDSCVDLLFGDDASQGCPSLYDYYWCAIYTVFLRDPISGRRSRCIQ